MEISLTYQGIIALLLALVLLNLANNLRSFRRLSSYTLPDQLHRPMISVLVPARNEERSIARCLESLLVQDYPYYEVIMLECAFPGVIEPLQTDRPAMVLIWIVASLHGFLPPPMISSSSPSVPCFIARISARVSSSMRSSCGLQK